MSKDEHARNKKFQQNKDIKKKQMKILELKTTITGIKTKQNLTDRLCIRMAMTEE